MLIVILGWATTKPLGRTYHIDVAQLARSTSVNPGAPHRPHIPLGSGPIESPDLDLANREPDLDLLLATADLDLLISRS